MFNQEPQKLFHHNNLLFSQILNRPIDSVNRHSYPRILYLQSPPQPFQIRIVSGLLGLDCLSILCLRYLNDEGFSRENNIWFLVDVVDHFYFDVQEIIWGELREGLFFNLAIDDDELLFWFLIIVRESGVDNWLGKLFLFLRARRGRLGLH